MIDVDMQSPNDEEEGQADKSMSLDDNPTQPQISPIQNREAKEQSSLQKVLSTIRDYLNRFLSQPLLVDKENA